VALEKQIERTHAWVQDLAKDVKGIDEKLGLLNKELSGIKETIAGAMGRMNIVIAIAGAIAIAFLNIAFSK
jgi:hypothetical protein